ncbi:MAG: hypothetical protein CM1200mP2_45670 [Planctomycetaceae bacterium]|nr:MAG: hypothetical protein CM1200mP2_45670 [Planctomycetaceae bacterium]
MADDRRDGRGRFGGPRQELIVPSLKTIIEAKPGEWTQLRVVVLERVKPLKLVCRHH